MTLKRCLNSIFFVPTTILYKGRIFYTIALGAIVYKGCGGGVRIFKTKWFGRFARKERISDRHLAAAVREVERGLHDGDLGGNLVKNVWPVRVKENGVDTGRFLSTAEATERYLSMDSRRATRRI